MNSILLKFATNLGIRHQNEATIRWSNIVKPSLGGITMYMVFLLSVACYSFFFDKGNVFHDVAALGILGATSFGFLLGLADDAYNTKPVLKLVAQLACGTFLAATGTIIEIFDIDVLNYAITFLWVVGIMNSINMLDNMDGITTIVSIFILLTIISYLGITNSYDSFYFIALLGALASLIGFLFHNWNPSKMFMGDTGSQFLGVLLAAVGIKFLWNAQSIGGDEFGQQQIAAVIIAFILPISDTTSVVINRIRRGQSPFMGGKDHTTHHLSYLGLTDSQVGLVFIGISTISLVASIASFKFIVEWNFWYSAAYFLYFVLVFTSLYLTTKIKKETD